jgi:hypothetical protein
MLVRQAKGILSVSKESFCGTIRSESPFDKLRVIPRWTVIVRAPIDFCIRMPTAPLYRLELMIVDPPTNPCRSALHYPTSARNLER